jgi:cytoskeletal protein RodZ
MTTERSGERAERPSPGKRFRELREAKGLTLEAASEATHVRVRYLDALEREDVESLLAAAYAKSFLKAYARLLEADEALVDHYRELIHDRWQTEPPSLDGEPSGGSVGKFVLLCVIGVALAVTVVVLLSSRASDDMPMSDGLGLGTTIPLTHDTTAHDSVVQARVSQTTPPAALTLEIVAVETTWVEIITDSTKRRSETLNPGEIRLVDADHDFTVTLGNARGVELRLNGKELPAFGPRGAVIRDAVITREILDTIP